MVGVGGLRTWWSLLALEAYGLSRQSGMRLACERRQRVRIFRKALPANDRYIKKAHRRVSPCAFLQTRSGLFSPLEL
jgi:hypothetical protein